MTIAEDDDRDELDELDRNPAIRARTPWWDRVTVVRIWVHNMLIVAVIALTLWVAALTWLLSSQVVRFHDKANDDRRDIACTFVHAYPGSHAPGLVALDKKYNCARYRP